MDELLTNVMIYWVTGTITSSQRFYRENFTSEEAQVWDKWAFYLLHLEPYNIT